MKSILLFFLTVFAITVAANAQITEGNWLVGGTASYSIEKGEAISNGVISTSKGAGFNLRSDIGFFLKDQFAIGLTPQFGFSNPEGKNNSSISFGLGPFARYYFLKPEKEINIFSQIGYFYGIGYRNGVKSSTSNGYNIKAGPAIFFNQSVALEVTLNYNRSKNKFESGSEAKFKGFNIGIGLQIHLEK